MYVYIYINRWKGFLISIDVLQILHTWVPNAFEIWQHCFNSLLNIKCLNSKGFLQTWVLTAKDSKSGCPYSLGGGFTKLQ